LIDEALRALGGSNRLAALVGGAGSGRSLLARCGVTPALKSGRLPGSDEWERLPPFMPGQDPLVDLTRALVPSSASDPALAAELARRLAADPRAGAALLAAARQQPVVLVVERFDEVMAQRDPAQVRAFADALLALLELPDPGVRVILVLGPA